jgi:Leucine rich repeat
MGNISYLGLENNGLEGPIPSEFGLMKELRYVHLSYNYLKSTIPTQLGHLSDLKYLLLDENELTGPIPSELGLLSGLRMLDVSGRSTKLTGSVPAEVCALPEVTIRVRCSQVACDCDCECT